MNTYDVPGVELTLSQSEAAVDGQSNIILLPHNKLSTTKFGIMG